MSEIPSTAVVHHDSDEVQSLVRLAIDKQVPVELLERILTLQERVNQNLARSAFFAAVTALQARCASIPKTKTAKIVTRKGTTYSYSYADINGIAEAVRPLLEETGLSYHFQMELVDRLMMVTCILRHVDGHTERSTFPVPIDTDAAMSDAQKNGAALTYGKRQSLVAVLGLSTTDEDVDAPGEPSTVDYITDQQAADLDALLDEAMVNRERFLAWLGVASIAEIPQTELKRAIAAAERKRDSR